VDASGKLGLMDFAAVLRERVPQLRLERVVLVETGWDSAVVEVDGEWIFRFPRRAEVVEWVRMEAGLLPELVPRLPTRVPQFEFVALDQTAFVGYRKLPGEPLAHGVRSAELGARLGEFLAALHAFPIDRARALTGRDGPADRRATVARFRASVLPLLEERDRSGGEALLDAALALRFEPALVHGDLGPEHILHRGDELTGVIDWSDARLDDPAIDLAWPLHGTSAPFREELLRSYGATGEGLSDRALVFHRLGPWHEVLYGLDEGRDELIASGLAGIRARLP
jgi:aminoglycoside phosphotransferase (APT) family kinase protein